MTADYLTTEEVAEIIRKSADYVARQCKAGNLRAKKLGNDWRISRVALDEFMSGGKAKAARERLTSRQGRAS